MMTPKEAESKQNFLSRISSEGQHALILGVLALFMASLPYFVGYAAQTSQQIFDGAVFGQIDYHSHLSRLHVGLRGEWTYQLLATSEDHDGAYVQTFYIALGQLARLSGLSIFVVYQLARVVFGALFLFAVYRFIRVFEPPKAVRRTAFALAAFSSGLGWLVLIIAPAGPDGISPIDFWLSDANSFFAILLFPHFCAAMALLLEIFTRLVGLIVPGAALASGAASGDDSYRSYRAIAVLTFLLTTIHPYAVAIVVGPMLVFGALRWFQRRLPANWWRPVVAMLLGAAPVLIYDVIIFTNEAVYSNWAAQNFTPSPPPMFYLLGYGLVLLLALVGVRRFAREQGARAQLILLWILVVALLVYFPVGIQRRFIEGLHVALCLIAAYGLTSIGARLSVSMRFVFVNFILVLAAMSNVYMVVGFTVSAASRDKALFHSQSLIAALDWLERESAWDDTVLAAEPTGNLLMGWIGHRVVLGHWAETVDYDERKRDVAAFYGAKTSDADRIAMLAQFGVRYVVYGEDERALGDFDPARVDYLHKVYEADMVSVHQVGQ